MPLNELARSRLANLGRRETLPERPLRILRCERCGLSVRNYLAKKLCQGCKAPMPEKLRPICRLCGEPCPGRRYSWCSDECVDAYNLVSSSAALRQATFARDRGICAVCGNDCDALQKRVNAMAYEQRGEAFVVLRENGFNVPLCRTSSCGSLWEADHVEPIDEGGSWEMRNVQTLCTPHHKEKTAEQAGRRARQLRLIGKKWRQTQKMLRLSQGGV